MTTGTQSAGAFVGVRIQGGLLPADLLSRLATGRDVPGMTPKDYHLAAGETPRDAANRVWAYLRGVWSAYREELAALPEGASATGLTRERFLLVLLDQLGYGRVPTTGRGGIATDDGAALPVSHVWGPVPIHLLGAHVPLDTRSKGVAGAAGQSPQSMVQELLNRSDEHLWAMLSNGRELRLLRDSTSLVGSAYIEFDLEAIFDGDLFADFLLLYTLCQQSRVEVLDEEVGPASCWLERWRTEAIETGSRALNLLRDGVVEALRILGAGFLTHPANARLRAGLESGATSVGDVNHALLRVVYRLLFTFVAEDRGVLLDPQADPQARSRYADYFSTARLRASARRRHGGRHHDRWRAQVLVWRALGSEDGMPELALPGIGGLFDPGELDFLTDCEVSNEALLAAVRRLSTVTEPKSEVRRLVDYRNLGAEELGSIYEALLEFVPQWDPATKTYTLDIASGNQRKDTGSYYTPTSLVDSLLDTALEPVLDDAVKSANDTEGQIRALLGVTVCDPACGSGHFLVGAARRMAKRVAALRTGDPEPAPGEVRAAMRDVVAGCIYGVDVNPLAAELAKVSLWMEAIEPGRPLTYLDAQIKVGNALLGTTPRLLADGLPNEAFKPIEGDDKAFCKSLTKRNRDERKSDADLFSVAAPAAPNRKLGETIEAIVGDAPLSLADTHVQRRRLRGYHDSDEYRRARQAADAWCAAFVWPKHEGAAPPLTHRAVAGLIDGTEVLDKPQRQELERLTARYRFFHWHLEFPHLFPTEPGPGDSLNDATGWAGGFAVVLGNPPWDRVKLQEQEFFATRDPDIATAANAAARKRLIAKLPEENPALYDDFIAERRRSEGISHLLRISGRYPLAGRGDINTYQVFAEGDRTLLAGHGRLGVILPTGIATDATTQYFFKDLVQTGSLASLYDFENRRKLFEAVDSRFKFCLLTIAGRDTRVPQADFAFFAHDPTDLQRPNTRFELTPKEIQLLNPNTGTCPVFRTRRDAEITLGIYKRVPVLINENDPVNGNPWGISFMTMFHMSNDSHLFHTREELEADGWTLNGNVFERERDGKLTRMLPLYEAKMIHHFDHQWATYLPDGTTRLVTAEEKADPNLAVMPRYWVREAQVDDRLAHKSAGDWLLGWRDICRSTDERTMIASLLPVAAVNHKLPLAFTRYSELITAMWSSFALDYVARQKIGGTSMTYFYLKQLPIPRPDVFDAPNYPDGDWIYRRVRQLSMFRAASRSALTAELDATFFYLYGIERDDIDYIMDTFPIVKRKDEAEFGEYRTKRMILEVYDAMTEAEATGIPYVSPTGIDSPQYQEAAP